MIKFLLSILLLASQAFAVGPMSSPQYGCIVASTNNIPTSYSLTDVGSTLLTLTSGTVATHIAVTTNTLSAAIALSVSGNPNITVPGSTSANKNQILLAASLLPALDDMRIANQILVRSNSGSALTTGTICVLAW